MADLDSDQIRHAVRTARERGFRQVRVRLGDSRFAATLPPGNGDEPRPVSQEAPHTALVQGPTDQSVESPAVGYFRALDPAVAVGDDVEEGEKVGEVVALGLANDVASPVAGRVEEVCVQDGQAVEFGQKVAIVRHTQ
ncbi:MAG: biotin/lipoyl-binding protein [Armatimonadetes bacterium]|nr:biotin/lipoyl-binding protein [Armatimonadota bacterium]